MPSKKNTASLSPSSSALTIDAIRHEDATRKNIPTAELQSVMRRDEQSPIRVAYARRNRDLDPQLVWRGKDAQDEEAELRVQAPPLYIQEKVHPQVLIEDLKRQTARAAAERAEAPHHLIDLIEPTDAYSAAQFVADARALIVAALTPLPTESVALADLAGRAACCESSTDISP